MVAADTVQVAPVGDADNHDGRHVQSCFALAGSNPGGSLLTIDSPQEMEGISRVFQTGFKGAFKKDGQGIIEGFTVVYFWHDDSIRDFDGEREVGWLPELDSNQQPSG